MRTSLYWPATGKLAGTGVPQSLDEFQGHQRSSACIYFLPLSVNFPTVTNRMNHNRLFAADYLVDDTVITHTKLIKSREIARKCFRLDVF
jgi:hypothetical protein